MEKTKDYSHFYVYFIVFLLYTFFVFCYSSILFCLVIFYFYFLLFHLFTYFEHIIFFHFYILGPDRLPHPSAYEAKSLQANVLFSFVYAPSGDLSIAVRNKRSHTNLSDVIVSVSCHSNLCSKGYNAPSIKIGEFGQIR